MLLFPSKSNMMIPYSLAATDIAAFRQAWVYGFLSPEQQPVSETYILTLWQLLRILPVTLIFVAFCTSSD